MEVRAVLPREVNRLLTRYLDLVDAALPGSLQALYLAGSLALDGYRPGASDVDFVAVLDAGVGSPLESLRGVHRDLIAEQPRPHFDGIYLAPGDLARDPAGVVSLAYTLEGTLTAGEGFEVNPVTWLLLHRRAVIVRGPAPRVYHDPDAVREWNRRNLNEYWAATAARLAEMGERVPPERRGEIVSWCVPGVTRLLYTIREGDVTSKAGACRYGQAAFPPYRQPVLALALRALEGQCEAVSDSDLKEIACYMRWVIDQANSAVSAGETP